MEAEAYVGAASEQEQMLLTELSDISVTRVHQTDTRLKETTSLVTVVHVTV